MRNKVFILSLSLIMVLCSSFSVFASTSRSVSFSEPATSDTQGYLAVMDGNNNCNVFFWSIQPYAYSAADNRGGVPSMNLSLNDDSLTFTALCTGSARVTLTRVYNSTNQYIHMSRAFTTSTAYTHTGMTDIRYFCYSGNVGVVDNNLSHSPNFLSMEWGDSSAYQSEFNNVVSKLTSIDSALSDLYARLGTTNSYIDSVESKLTSIDSNLEGLADLIESLEETNNLLRDIENEIDSVEEYLTDIVAEIDYVEERLEQISSRLSLINENLLLVNSNILLVNNNILLVNENIVTLNGNVIVTNQRLTTIINLLREMQSAVGKEDTSALDDSSIGSLGNDEDAVLSDDSSKLDDLSFSFGNAFDVVWDMISEAWQANSKVFTLVIMCLTVGLIKLILNR